MTAHMKQRNLPTIRQMQCLNCGKRRLCEYGICRECVDLPPRDGESPHRLPGRWVPNGRGTLDYIEGEVAS